MTENAKIIINKNSNVDENLKRIDDIIKSIKFGSITIHVENGKIIQVDKNEKIRFS